MEQEKLSAKQANLSTDRLLCLVEFMAQRPEAMRLSDIASGCEMNISTVHRFLASLLAAGYADQDEESGLYRLTFGFCRLGESIRAHMDLRGLCLPHLRQVAQETGRPVQLVREYNMTALCAEAVPGDLRGEMLPEYAVLPLHTSASGKLILSCWPFRRLEELAQLKPLKIPATGVSLPLSALRRELMMVRAKGYALDNEESERGWRSIAAPLRDYTNQVIAALEIRSPTRFWQEEEALACLPALGRAAERLSGFLGYDPSQDRPPAFRR